MNNDKQKLQKQHQIHPFPPIYDRSSLILILGSFPSVKSREEMFYYGHPQNRFWNLMGLFFNENGSKPRTVEEKKSLLLSHHIALWDTIASCDISGSSDSSITNVVANDISLIIESTDIRRIYCNGKTSHKLYTKYCKAQTGMDAIALPSTSPANAAWDMDRLQGEWRQILSVL